MELLTKDLTTWLNTSNNTDFEPTSTREEGIKNLYIEFFKQAKELKNRNFCKYWLTLFDTYRGPFLETLTTLIPLKEIGDTNPEKRRDIEDKIYNKFKGNCGEILIEELINDRKKLDFMEYKPVEDRQHEDFTDATAVDRDDVKIGIQIKNHSNPIGLDVFVKAADMYSRDFDLISEVGFEKYIKRPRQYIVSFSYKNPGMELHKEFDSRVKFIGPDTIDKALHNEEIETIFNHILKGID